MRWAAIRLAGLVATALGVAVVVFVVLRVIPGDAISAQLGVESGALSDAQRQALEQYYGLDKPLLLQFWSWLTSVFQGNLGASVVSGRAVSGLIGSAIPVTVELAVLALLIGTPIGVVAGIIAASRPGGARDGITQGVTLLGLAIPEFVVGSIVVAVLAEAFGYFPDTGTFVPLTRDPAGNLSQMLYPALVLAIGLAANVMRTTRGAFLEVANADFVRTARGKGVPVRQIRLRHILRNASVPVLTITGIQFGYLLGGTVIVEEIFALPGVGRLLFNSIKSRDYPVVQSTVLIVAIGFVLVNVAVDLLYRAIDPRQRTQA